MSLSRKEYKKKQLYVQTFILKEIETEGISEIEIAKILIELGLSYMNRSNGDDN